MRIKKQLLNYSNRTECLHFDSFAAPDLRRAGGIFLQ